MRRRLSVLLAMVVMLAMMLATSPAALAANDGPRPGDPGHPTCTKAAPHSPVIEPGPGGSCFLNPAGPKK